jgi:large subunit ribosomal protein L30
MAKKKINTIKVKYFRSMIGRPESQKKIVRGLGFRKLNKILEKPDTPEIRGMVNKISHLVEIVEGE